jgi:NTE family protein
MSDIPAVPIRPASPYAKSLSAQRKRVALVIGAGSVKCAAALGLWRALVRAGIGVDMVVGCSGGSMYASLMALGYDHETCERLTRQLWTRKITQRRNTRGLLSAFLPKVFGFDGRFGMVDDRAVHDALSGPFGGRQFQETVIPLHIVATDFMTGERVVLSEGSIFDAVRASIAIPYVWRPWQIGERLLMDGCMSDPLPVDVAIREGAQVILAMAFESPFPRRIKSATRFAFQVNSVYTNNLLRANYAFHNLAHHTEIIPVLPEFDSEIGLFDTHKIPHVIEQGERATEAQLPYLHRLLDGIAV